LLHLVSRPKGEKEQGGRESGVFVLKFKNLKKIVLRKKKKYVPLRFLFSSNFYYLYEKKKMLKR